jgi:phosphoserine phosphatase
MRSVALVDMDGTLANVSGIRHMVDGLKQKKDFHAFHRASEFVPANKQAIDFCKRHHKAGNGIVIVTARMEEWKPHTTRFYNRELVEAHGVPVLDSFYRPNGDYRKDYEVKKEILTRIRELYIPVAAIDDNPNIITLWEEEQIPEIEIVPGWDHEGAAKYAAIANRNT